MTPLTLSRSEKKAYGKAVGEILARDYGKQQYYSSSQVHMASREVLKPGFNWHCWAMCLYTSPTEFKSYHDSINETFDYAAMKAEMTSALTDGASNSWFDLELSWLEWPDIELPSIYDFIDGV
jgi:hypothetical protein